MRRSAEEKTGGTEKMGGRVPHWTLLRSAVWPGSEVCKDPVNMPGLASARSSMDCTKSHGGGVKRRVGWPHSGRPLGESALAVRVLVVACVTRVLEGHSELSLDGVATHAGVKRPQRVLPT